MKKKISDISSIINGFWFAGLEENQKKCNIFIFDVDFSEEDTPSPSIDNILKYDFDLGIFFAWSLNHHFYIKDLLSSSIFKASQLQF